MLDCRAHAQFPPRIERDRERPRQSVFWAKGRCEPNQERDVIIELNKTFRFEAAHLLPNVHDGHKCRRLHGHSYQIELVLVGEIDEKMGWLMDFADVRAAWQPVHDTLDHYYLNEIPGLENPTSEVLAHWIFERLTATLPDLDAVIVHETCTSSATYRKR